MTIKEETRDLLTVPQGYYLAHCISADFLLNVGLARSINNSYDMGYKLHYFYEERSSLSIMNKALLIDNVYNLVVKFSYKHETTYYHLMVALLDMREDIERRKITKLAMPRIACGKGHLDWECVSWLIQEIFKNLDIDILICNL